jgi:hypothetical protein
MVVDAEKRVESLTCRQNKVEARPLARGMTNPNFLVFDGGEKFVLRLGGDIPAHGVMRFNELAAKRAGQPAAISEIFNTIDRKRTFGKLAANRRTLIAVSAWNPPDQHLDDRARLHHRPSRQTAAIRPPHSKGSRQIAAILKLLPV